MQNLAAVLYVLKDVYDSHVPFQIALDKAFDRYTLTPKDRELCGKIAVDTLRHALLTQVEIAQAFPKYRNSDEQSRLLQIGLRRLRRAKGDEAKAEKEINMLQTTSDYLKLNLTKEDFENLMKLAASPATIPEEMRKDPLVNNSLVFNCPQWVLNAYISEYGVDKTIEVLKSQQKEPLLYLAVNTGVNTVDDYKEDERFEVLPSVNPDYKKGGLLLAKKGNRASSYPETAEGKLFPQDLSWFRFLDVLPIPQYGNVLHVSAKNGIVSSALALRAKPVQAQVKAVYPEGKHLVKAKALHERLNLSNIEDLLSSTLMLKTVLEFDSQDLVVVTPTCSHLGQANRRPDVCVTFDADNLGILVKQMDGTLLEASFFVRNGGHLAYAVPSLLKEEGERIINAFLAKREEFQLVTQKTMFPTDEGEHRMDGFYYAVLVRKDKDEKKYRIHEFVEE